MINSKDRAQMYYQDGTHFFRSEGEARVLNPQNATYVSASNVDDATVTFSHSASVEGESYIKINIGTSTSTAASDGVDCAKYLFWDTGFRGYNTPSICLTMDCSGALESDLVTAANAALPVVVYGWCWADPSAVPHMTGFNGRDGSGGPIITWLAFRMGNGTNVSIECDADHGTSAFSFASSNTSRGTAAGCRGFRNKIVANTMIFDTNDKPETWYYYTSWLNNTPGTNCDGDNIQQNVKNTKDEIEPNDKLYVFVGAGNTATGGDASTFAGIFKAMIK